MVLKVKINLIILAGFILITACSGQNEEIKKPRLKAIPSHNTASNDSIVSALGEQLETSMYEGEIDFFIEKFHLERFNELATYSEYENSQIKKFKKGFVDGFSNGIKNLPQKIINTTEIGGFYDFINYYYDSKNHTYRMLFRLFSEEEGINYHDFELVSINGEFYIQDIYIYLTGENLSDTANMIYLMSLPKNLFEKIVSGNNSKDMKHLFDAVNSQKANENETALSQLNLIQGKLKQLKFYHVIKILITSSLDDSNYMDAMKGMQLKFKDDPTCQLLSIDYYVMREEFDKALNALENLEEQTNDSFLNYLKGNIAFSDNNHKDAIMYFEKVIEDYPEYYTPKFNMLSSYSELSNYTECVSILDQIKKEGLYTTSELIEYVESKEEDGSNQLLLLEKSKDYQNWKSRQSL